MYNQAFLPIFSKVCALPASHTLSADVCTGPGLAVIHLADTTLPQHLMIGVVTC
jgi:hypothetical protein